MQSKRQKKRFQRLMHSEVTWLRTLLLAMFGSFAALLCGSAVVAGRIHYKPGRYWFEATPEKLPVFYWGWIVVLGLIAIIFLGKSFRDFVLLIRLRQ